MNNFFNLIIFNIKQKKGLFLLLLLLTALVIILSVFAGFNLKDGLFTVDLSNICYIQFLKGECGWSGLFFGLVFSLLIFVILILLFSYNKYLYPLSILFYLYLVYSQIFIIVNLIIIYGILNCIILILLLIIYNFLLIFLFFLILLDINNHCVKGGYLKNCFNLNISLIPICLLSILCLCLIFSLILIILKSYVLLLIF